MYVIEPEAILSRHTREVFIPTMDYNLAATQQAITQRLARINVAKDVFTRAARVARSINGSKS